MKRRSRGRGEMSFASARTIMSTPRNSPRAASIRARRRASRRNSRSSSQKSPNAWWRIATSFGSTGKVSQAVDYEAELGVIIGKGGRGIEPSHALDHVWGYTIINDVTARDLQGRHSQWLIGKSQDTFCPMGPWAVTRDEIDLADTQIRCWINGELRQNANTRDLIFDVPTIIATISAGVTLCPGRHHRDRHPGRRRNRLHAA